MKTNQFILTILIMLITISVPCNATNNNKSKNPTCVLMKFTDDTRYDLIESADFLSELVMEKMIASGRFNLKEIKPINQNMEDMLYDEKVNELIDVEKGLKTGDFNELFEGGGFKENKAQSIATAIVGQFVTPEITLEIGKSHGADYLIQGTIVNLGIGNWWNDDFSAMSVAINMASSLASAPIASSFSGPLGPLGGLLGGGIDIQKIGIGVQSDIRVIKADTGEVIWSKRVIGIQEQKQVGIGFFTFGHSKLNAEMYTKAMNKAANEIVNAMIVDMDANKLFVK